MTRRKNNEGGWIQLTIIMRQCLYCGGGRGRSVRLRNGWAIIIYWIVKSTLINMNGWEMWQG